MMVGIRFDPLSVLRAGMLSALALALTSCGSAIPDVQEADLTLVPRDIPSLTLKELRTGRRLYAENCGACHRLKAPEELTDSRWIASFSRMRNRVHLTPTEEEWIIAYLRTFAQRATPADSTR
jgi:cytochrome c1